MPIQHKKRFAAYLEAKLENLDSEHVDLIEEILDALTDKYKSMPIVNRNLLAIATVEATAMIVAAEVDMHCELLGYKRDDAISRIYEYEDLFTRNALASLDEGFMGEASDNSQKSDDAKQETPEPEASS